MKFFAGVRLLISALILTGLGFGLQACSGGGGGGSSTPVDANATGYYTGSADVKTPASPATNFNIPDLQIMINGSRIMMMSDAKAVLYDGTFTVSGNTLTSTVAIYYNGNKQTGAVGTATLNATITQGSQITGSFTGTELGNGTFVSTYSSLNDTASIITNVEYDNTGANNRSWTTNPNEATTGNNLEIEIYNNFDMRYNISPGDLTFRNCVITKATNTNAYVPITNTSLFTVSVIFDNCDNPVAVNTGTYTGFSQYKPGTPNKIAFAITNGTYALTDDFNQI